MPGFKNLVMVFAAASAALWAPAASSAVVTWTIELNSRVVGALGASGQTSTNDPRFVPRTITIQTVIDASSTTFGPFTQQTGGEEFTGLQQNFATPTGVEASPLSPEFDSFRQTRVAPVQEGGFFYGGDEYTVVNGVATSRTYMIQGASRIAYDCGTLSCGDPTLRSYTDFQESFELGLTNDALNNSAADVQALTLEDYLGLLQLPGTTTYFYSIGAQTTTVQTCDAFGDCSSQYAEFTSVTYTGRVLDASLLAVPEPGALGLVGLALAGLAFSRRQRGTSGVPR